MNVPFNRLVDPLRDAIAAQADAKNEIPLKEVEDLSVELGYRLSEGGDPSVYVPETLRALQEIKRLRALVSST